MEGSRRHRREAEPREAEPGVLPSPPSPPTAAAEEGGGAAWRLEGMAGQERVEATHRPFLRAHGVDVVFAELGCALAHQPRPHDLSLISPDLALISPDLALISL